MQLSTNFAESGYFLLELNDNSLLDMDEDSIDIILNVARNLSKSWQNPTTVIVWQKKVAGGFSRNFYRRLGTSILREHLTRLLVKIRLLLRLVRKSPSTWIYLSHSECLGISAEFALACDHHFCTSKFLRFGFPEIYAGMYPWGGLFESSSRSNSRSIESWRSRPIRILHKGDLHVPVTFIKDERISELLPLIIENLVQKNISPMAADQLIPWYEKLLETNGYDLLVGIHTRDHFEDSLQCIKKAENKEELASWFIQATTAYMFTQDFLTSLSKSSGSNPTEITNSEIYIDVSQAMIDSLPFREILASGTKVIICSLDREKVQRALELMYLGLERSSNKRSLVQWEEQVYWYVGVPPVHCDLIRYQIDRTIEFSIGGKNWKGILIKNSPDRPHVIGINSASELDAGFLSFSGYRVVRIPSGENIVSSIRAWALEEILSVAPAMGGQSELLDTLKDSDWGFISQESEWDQYMRHRHSDEFQPTSAGSKLLDQATWEIVTWHQFKVLVNSRVHSGIGVAKGKISEHFHIFSVMVFSVLCKSFKDIDRAELAVLVSTSLGLPKSYSLPVRDLNQISTRRWSFYISKHWPDFSGDYLLE